MKTKRRTRNSGSSTTLKGNDKVWETIGWSGAVYVVVGYSLNANHIVYCWPIWILGNGLIAAYSYRKEAYSTMVMSLVILIMNIYGWISWS